MQPIRISPKTKNKLKLLKGSGTYDLCIDNLITQVEIIGQSKQPEVSDLVKKRTDAIIKILRAFEKDYLVKTKYHTEQILDKLYNENDSLTTGVTAPKMEPETIKLLARKDERIEALEKQLKTAISSPEESRTLSPLETNAEAKTELLDIIEEIRNKGEEKLISGNYMTSINSFFFTQKLDLLRNKINKF